MSIFDAPCGASHDDLTSITCERAKGHPGEHEGYTAVTWDRDPGEEDTLMPDPVLLHPGAPHSPEYTRQLAEAFSASVRCMNHATLFPDTGGLRYASDVDDVLSLLSGGIGALPQLLRQLGKHLADEGAAGRLEVRHGPYTGTPSRAATDVDYYLREAAGYAHALHETLNQVHQVTATIGNREDGDG